MCFDFVFSVQLPLYIFSITYTRSIIYNTYIHQSQLLHTGPALGVAGPIVLCKTCMYVLYMMDRVYVIEKMYNGICLWYKWTTLCLYISMYNCFVISLLVNDKHSHTLTILKYQSNQPNTIYISMKSSASVFTVCMLLLNKTLFYFWYSCVSRTYLAANNI
jgi:hypothetical protein